MTYDLCRRLTRRATLRLCGRRARAARACGASALASRPGVSAGREHLDARAACALVRVSGRESGCYRVYAHGHGHAAASLAPMVRSSHCLHWTRDGSCEDPSQLAFRDFLVSAFGPPTLIGAPHW